MGPAHSLYNGPICVYLSDEVQTEMVLDVSPEALGEVADHLTLIDAAHRRPPLPFVVPDSLPEALW